MLFVDNQKVAEFVVLTGGVMSVEFTFEKDADLNRLTIAAKYRTGRSSKASALNEFIRRMVREILNPPVAVAA